MKDTGLQNNDTIISVSGLVKSFDNVYGTLYTPIRSSTTEFKHNLNNSITKYFNNICEIETPHYCLNYNSFVTLNVYKSSVTVADNTNAFTRIERNVGEIFEFNDPRLSNWYFKCYSIINLKDIYDHRLRIPLEPYKQYEGLFIEFLRVKCEYTALCAGKHRLLYERIVFV